MMFRRQLGFSSVVLLLSVSLSICYSSSSSTNTIIRPSSVAWTVESFPSPGSKGCRSFSNRLCDPDGILIEEDRQRVSSRITELEGKIAISCGARAKETSTLTSSGTIEMAVVVVDRINLIGTYETSRKSVEEAATEHFAIQLHNLWGVGKVEECGSTGILALLSIRDRAFYLSRGNAMEPILTDTRLDRMLDKIRPILREQQYGEAVLSIVEQVHHYLELGPPSSNELRNDMLEKLIPLSFLLLVMGFFTFKNHRDRQEARVYARVQSQLTQLDRDRALALQGTYQCTSCPICLESFEPPIDASNVHTMGSDKLPLKLLRCGHVFDETCWNDWVCRGAGNLDRCPICQQSVGPSNENNYHRIDDGQGDQPGVMVDNHRVYRQFHRERYFRLLQLSTQFPRYIRHDDIQRWTDVNYDGSLAQDPTFLRHNPTSQSSIKASNGSSSNYNVGGNFGGGRSSGGRGGTW
jgi:uncharacterized membrane protein YgcG